MEVNVDNIKIRGLIRTRSISLPIPISGPLVPPYPQLCSSRLFPSSGRTAAYHFVFPLPKMETESTSAASSSTTSIIIDFRSQTSTSFGTSASLPLVLAPVVLHSGSVSISSFSTSISRPDSPHRYLPPFQLLYPALLEAQAQDSFPRCLGPRLYSI
ncbi:hypothetical protein GYMLUDRAFT_560126 [Collybiopsis luxurians FD-317 M1]|uniref:Uncharacterized protein n=1 Tax=Collybiopsis luxurians FD-317 M1 TaxID=944289 RepID=A0A0D0C1F0_9AGAR|nr:hypothetical protein GYMLUDRAFT_560126 [Collybiopsis luxurians FD-317 M1]